LKRNNADCALEAFRRALQQDPHALLPLYHEGLAYRKLSNDQRAAQDFQAVLKQKEDFADAHIGLGEAEEALGQPLQAESNYRRAHALDPNSSQAAAHLASVLEKEGQQTAAIRYWKEALASEPASEPLKLSLAVAFLNSGQNEMAAQFFKEIVKQHPDSGDAAIDLGTSLSRQGRYTDAIEAYRNALTIPAVHDLALLSLSKALVTLLRYAEAAPYIEQYVGSHSNEAQAHVLRGIVYRRLGQVRDAEIELGRAVQLSSQDYDGQYNLGAVLQEDHRGQEAIAHLKQAVALRPHSTEAHYQLARAYYATHQTSLAESEEAALREEEQNRDMDTRSTVLGNQALSAIEDQDLQKAAELYREIIVLVPTDAKAHYDLALVYERLNDRTQERNLLNKAAALGPSLAYVHSQLGYIDMLEGKVETAESEFKLALARDPQSVRALGNLGVLYGRTGRVEEATHLLRLATDNDPHYATGYLNLGLLLAAQGNYTEAMQELQKSLAIAPHDTTVNRALEQVRLEITNESGANGPSSTR
jgi:tetratricopeptide (TPR) repeat protein